MNTQNNEVEMVNKTDESMPEQFGNWKHTGAMVVIGIYMLFTLPPDL